nr:hypothetical protein [Tanacetum cinerariifolium]
PDVPTDESEEELSWNSTDDEGDDNEEKDADGDEEDEGNDGKVGNGNDDNDENNDGEEGDDYDADQEVVRDDDKDDDQEDEEEGRDDDQEYVNEYAEETRDEESFDPIPQTPKNSDDEGDGEEDQGLNIGEEERHVEEEEKDELYRDVNINQGRGLPASLEVEDSHVTLTPVKPDGMESIFGTTPQMDVQTPTSVAPLPITAPTMTSSTITITTTTTSQWMNEAVRVAVQIQSDRLRDKAQRENAEFLTTIDKNIKQIIKEQVKDQVKVQVSKILPRIEQAVNKQLETKVLTRSSHSSRTSYDVAADLSEMELKKILIEKMEGNKRRDDDADKDEEPSARPDWGSKRRREGKEPGSASALTETATRSTEDLVPRTMWINEPIGYDKHALWGVSHWGHKRQQFYSFAVNWEFARDVYSKRRIIAVTELKIVEWHSYKHLDLITMRRDDDKLYKSIVIQRCVEDLQLGVESYQKKLNLTKPDSYRFDLKRKEANTAYSNPQGFIYQNKDKKNRLMRIDELHKFSDGTLTDVHTALDYRLKGIQMRYLP